MFHCPHCSKPIEVAPPNVAWWRHESGGRNVSLGCGTLILIAIIVYMFSRGDTDAINDLRKEIQTLEEKIDNIQVKLQPAQPATPELQAE